MAKFIEIHPEAIKANRQARKEAREKRKAEKGEKKPLGIGAKIAIVSGSIAVGAGAAVAAMKLCTNNPEILTGDYPMEVAGAEVPVPEVVEEANIEVGEV